MADEPAPPRGRGPGAAGIAAGLAGLACLALLFEREVGFGAAADWLGESGYPGRVEARLEAGDPAGALEVLEAGTLLDAEALALLDRTRVPSVLEPTLTTDRRLREAIGRRLANDLLPAARLDAEARALLDRAVDNGERLVALAPGDAEAHALLGSLYLKRSEVGGAPIDAMHAARSLRRAIQLDPDQPRAAALLPVALRRARQQ